MFFSLHKVEEQLNGLRLHLGYSHPIDFSLPSGVTAKVEMDALAGTAGASTRQRKRHAAETKAIQEQDPDGQ